MRRALSFLLLTCLSLVGGQLQAQSAPDVARLMATADAAWRAKQYDSAYVRYALVLRQDSSVSQAVYRMATLLGWRRELDRSIALFRLYVHLAPGDDDGRIALARALAWRGLYLESLALSDSILATNHAQRDAALLAAQTLAWSGRLDDAIARYQGWLSSHEDDAEAWVALGQTWRWAGRPAETRLAVEHALNADPRSEAALSQREWARTELASSLEPTITNTNDSDDNHSTLYRMRGGLATPWSARLVTDASFRAADLDARHATSTTLRTSSSWSPLGGPWSVHGEIGAARLDGTDGAGSPELTRYEPILGARVSGRLTPRVSLGAGVSRIPFDETAPLILAGIATTSIEGNADVGFLPRVSFVGHGGWSRYSGGSGPNSRAAASGALRWSFGSVASIAAGVRGFNYQHASFDGYFTPKRYLLTEASARVRLGADRGWGFDSEIGLGNQSITAFDGSRSSRLAQRAGVSFTYRPSEALEWISSGGFANVASPTTISSSDYRAYTFMLGARWRI